MLDLVKIRKDPKMYTQKLKERGFEFTPDYFEKAEKLRRKLVTKRDEARARHNELSKQVGKLRVEGKEVSDEIFTEIAQVNFRGVRANHHFRRVAKSNREKWDLMPNIASDNVPAGEEEESKIVLEWQPSDYVEPTDPKPHWELEKGLRTDLGAKLSGSRFSVYEGSIAELERLIIDFMLQRQVNAGYTEHQVPLIVNEECLYGTGQLPKFKKDLFRLENGQYLIPTAEVPLTNMYREQILREANLPIMVCAYTPCFRAEAGSYGQDTKGIIRQHQFNKVELVKITTPEQAVLEYSKMIEDAEWILRFFKLKYRKVLLNATDMGFAATECHDLEVWAPGMKKWLEVSSISHCGDFQARRAKIRYKGETGKAKFAHTMNGSGLATSRLLPAIIETFQKDGEFNTPQRLKSYLNMRQQTSQ